MPGRRGSDLLTVIVAVKIGRARTRGGEDGGVGAVAVARCRPAERPTALVAPEVTGVPLPAVSWFPSASRAVIVTVVVPPTGERGAVAEIVDWVSSPARRDRDGRRCVVTGWPLISPVIVLLPAVTPVNTAVYVPLPLSVTGLNVPPPPPVPSPNATLSPPEWPGAGRDGRERYRCGAPAVMLFGGLRFSNGSGWRGHAQSVSLGVLDSRAIGGPNREDGPARPGRSPMPGC